MPCALSIPLRRFLLFTSVVVLAGWPAAQLAAQDDFARARGAPLDQALPLDGEVTAGVLDNGLRYFVRENSEPRNRIFLRLVVNAGSLLEEEDERGAAHFLEHMAFNGTERFPKAELVSFMESIGMRVGVGLNARTGFDDTAYTLVLPSDTPANIEKAFDILEDWASGLSLDTAEIEAERGVVLEEWRAGRGAGSRINDKHLPILFRGSRYADRLPIGTPESIRSMDRETLLGFYRKWYRPNLMAVIAVGDFDAEQIERAIRARFASLEAPAQAPPRIPYAMPAQDGTAFSIATDPEQPTTSVALVHKMPPKTDWTVRGFRNDLVEQVYNGLLNLRLQEIAREADAPFLGASSQSIRPVRATSAYQLSAAVSEDGVERGLQTLLAEAMRVARFGFTPTELERAKTSMLRGMERRWAARDSRPSPLFVEQLTEGYLLSRGIPSIELERGLHERFVPEITLEEVNAVARGWLDDSNRVVLVTGPEKEGLILPEPAALAAVIESAATMELEAYVDDAADAPLIETPSGSKVIAERRRGGGVTEWGLANGILVVLKPTDFNKDEILFRGFLPGGISVAADDDLIPAKTALPVVMSGGLGNLDPTALQRALTGKVVTANATISETDVGVFGQASARDLQTLFELIHLRFTKPRADANVYAALQNQMRAQLANRGQNPAVAFNDAFTRIMTRGHPRAQPLTVDSLAGMSLERSLSFYKERFANARGATFVFVGAFDPETIRPLVETYLGGLPASAQPESWRDHGIRPPDAVVEETVYKGIEPRAQTRIAFHGPIDMHDLRNPTTLTATGMVLQTQLREALREELGATYSAGVRSEFGWIPVEAYTLVIEFSSDPARADALAGRVFAEIAKLKESPPADKVADVRASMLRTYETNQRQNGWWLTGLAATYQFESKIGPDNLLAFGGVVEGLTAEAVRDAARQYIDTERYVRVTLLAETAAASTGN